MNKTTTFMSFEIDFQSPDTLEQLCQQQIGYVYIGGTDQSFNDTQLISKRDWYDAVLTLPKAQLYQVAGCFQ